MKKILTILFICMCAVRLSAEMRVQNSELKRISWIVKGDVTGTQLLTEGNNQLSVHIDWVENQSGKRAEQALVRVLYDGMPMADIYDIAVTLDQGAPLSIKHETEGQMETWIIVPLQTKTITLSHIKHGTTKIHLQEMTDRDVWTVPVFLDKLVSIQVNPLTDNNQSVRVYLISSTGHEVSGYTPATFTDVLPGEYTLRFVVNNSNRFAKITVSPTQTIFTGNFNPDLDFRNFREIMFESTDPNTGFFLDDRAIGSGLNAKAEVSYGTHKIVAKVNTETSDEKTFEVSETSSDIVYLSPTQTKTFEVIGLYNGKPAPTTVSVTNLDKTRYDETTASNSHKFTLPVNDKTKYKFTLNYNGHKGSKELKVTPTMKSTHEIKLRSSRSMNADNSEDFIYKTVTGGWEFSYVAKQYSTSGRLYEDSDIKTTIKENGVWDDGYDHWLHGFRTGPYMVVAPDYKFGLGLYTGLFLEFYFSGNEYGIDDVYDKYFEWDMSIPLHLLYQVHFGGKVTIGFHTGPSFNWAMTGSYYDKFLPSDETNNEPDWTDFWDEDWAPARVNFTWDFGLFIQLGRCRFSGLLSRGLTDNKMHTGFGERCRTVMNKNVLAFSISF